MAENDKPTKPEPAPPKPDAAAASRKTKLVAETGRYVCREPLVYTTTDGRRATAKVGEVISMLESDAKTLKRRRVVDSEEETAEG